MGKSPENKPPIRPVPKAADKHRGKKEYIGQENPFSVSTQRDVNVIP